VTKFGSTVRYYSHIGRCRQKNEPYYTVLYRVIPPFRPWGPAKNGSQFGSAAPLRTDWIMHHGTMTMKP